MTTSSAARSAHPSPAPGPRRPVGRPRSSTADEAILAAAIDLLADVGVNGLTMSGVVERSGVARATVYRRYPTREALTLAALAQVKGREPFQLTGDVPTDIAQGVHAAAAVLGSAAFRRFLPLFVAEALRGPAEARAQIARVAPNHGNVAREYADVAARAGYRADVDPGLVSDIAMGAMIMRLLSTGRPPSREIQQQLIDVLERGLRADAAAADDAAASADDAEGAA